MTQSRNCTIDPAGHLSPDANGRRTFVTVRQMRVPTKPAIASVFCWLVCFYSVGIFGSHAQAQTSEEVAAAVVIRAEEAYAAGDFERAVVLLQGSLAMHEAPSLHYNLARTLSELSRWEESRAHYVRFLELAPDASQRGAVEARIAELDRRIERGDGQVPVDPEGPAEPAPPNETETNIGPASEAEPRPSSAPWILVGVGVVVAAAAIPLGLASNNAEAQAGEAATHREGALKLDDARRFARVTNGLLIAGGAVAVAGLLWAVLRPKRSDDQRVTFDGTSLRLRF